MKTTFLNCIFFTLLFSSISLNRGYAQRTITVTPKTRICYIDHHTKQQQVIYLDNADPKAQALVDDICKKMGIQSKSFTLKRGNVENASALSENDGIRYIVYNPIYLSKLKENKKDWAVLFVLAHEIGHHVNSHTLSKTDNTKRKDQELEADQFAGCGLAHLGASWEEVEKAMSNLSEEEGDSHPPKSARMMYAQKGWENCTKKAEPVPPSPKPQPENDDTKKPCYKNQTGDIAFKNTGNQRIMIVVKNGYERVRPTDITLEAGETGSFYSLPAEGTTFEVWSMALDALGNSSFVVTKTIQHRVVQCEENPTPINVRAR